VGEPVNCYAYALGLFDHLKYWEILDKAQFRIPAQGLLIHDLIAVGLLKRLQSSGEGALVVYAHDCIGHAGRVVGNSVRSKWSPGGCVWDHAPLEVPARYGRVVGYYATPSIDDTLAIFQKEMTGICKRAFNWYHKPFRFAP
jgi:hypothetical protein